VDKRFIRSILFYAFYLVSRGLEECVTGENQVASTKMSLSWIFLGLFGKLWKVMLPTSPLSVHLFARPHGTTRLP